MRHGRGTYRYASGAVFEGEYKAGRRHGRGTFRFANGEVKVTRYEADKAVGEGAVRLLNGDLWRMQDGQATEKISLEEARRIAEAVGEPVPPM